MDKHGFRKKKKQNMELCAEVVGEKKY